MKTLILTAIMLLSLSKINSQTIQEILSPEQMKVTWLGLDFIHGKYDMKNPDQLKKYLPDYFIRINKLIAEDHHRYFFPVAYKKDFEYNTKTIDDLNNTADSSLLVDSKKKLIELNPEKINEIVSQYNFPESLTGIGLVYIYESLMQGGNDKATIWMAYIDIKTKKVLFLQSTTSGVEGQNLEESWAYPVISMLRKSKAELMKWDTETDKFNLANK